MTATTAAPSPRSGAARRAQHRRRRALAAGFSMMEVLVSILVTATGLLGFAKLQAAALSNTQTARVRSLIALQASSLSAAMIANRRFWASAAAPASVSVRGGVVSGAGMTLSSVPDCHAGGCTPEQLAAYDMQAWADTLKAQFPSHIASVACAVAAPQPPHCTIDIRWSEKTIAINRSTSLAPADMVGMQQYNLYVEP